MLVVNLYDSINKDKIVKSVNSINEDKDVKEDKENKEGQFEKSNFEKKDFDYERVNDNQNDNNDNINISEEDVFSYGNHDDVLFNNHSQSYIVSENDKDEDDNESLSNPRQDINQDNDQESRHNISTNTEIEKVTKKDFFEKMPEKVFKDIILHLTKLRLSYFLENESLKQQIDENERGTKLHKEEHIQNHFNLTNNFNNNSKIHSSTNINEKKNQKIDDLVIELNGLIEMFEKSKKTFGNKGKNGVKLRNKGN